MPLSLDRPRVRRTRPTTRSTVMGAAAVLVAVLVTAGCAPEPSPRPETPSATATPEPTATTETPQEPALVPDGTAEDNLAYFTPIVEAVWAGPENLSGRAYIDALVAAGFDKTAMQVTEDFSTVGNPAESIQFSVHWGEECLVGQVGPATGEPVTAVIPALAEGGCLIGSTRPIDW